jgi:tripartite-type tricarboxylate transporter receptor subunit TctC
MQELKRSKSGGYDFAFGDIGTLAVNPNVFASIPYDSLKDFLPVVDLFWSSSVVWVSNDSPYKTLRQLLDAGKASPGKLTYASTGSGSPTYMTAETLLYNAGKLDFLEIPFKEMGSLLTALATNEVDMLVAAVATAQPVMSRVRPLAVQSRTRLPQYPNIPTVEEAAGLPGFHYQSWGALITNAGVSPAIVNQVRADAIDVLKQADAKAKLAGFAVEDSRGMDSNALLALIQADIESTREPIKAAAERSRSRK